MADKLYEVDSDANPRHTRVEVFAALQSLSEVAPEMRTGQLIAAVGELCMDLHRRGLWDASDTELLEAIWQFQRNFEAAAVSSTFQKQ